jgi:hypothetical protein
VTPLLAGYGENVITPPLGVELSGYGFYLGRRAASVLDDLKARAFYLRSGAEALGILSLDIIGLEVAAADRIRDEAGRALGLPRENVLLSCTHTHTGPATQPLPGIGEIDPAYVETLPAAVASACSAAVTDATEADLLFGFESLEPIGFNRRTGDFDRVDPSLAWARFGRPNGGIFLLNYACHAVTLGRSSQVSADWPGAAVAALESRGHRALLLQGFCGDIDPVTNLNRWGAGTESDLRLYGEIIADRALKAERLAAAAPRPEESGHLRAAPRLVAAEKRIRLPLAVPDEDAIEGFAAFFREKNASFPGADRFADEWAEAARARYRELSSKPFIDNVPIQALAVGDMRILALPGEAFSTYARTLRRGVPGLLTAGYSNGNIGYLPSGVAFEDRGDYAAVFAPMFYSVFPFSPDLPSLLIHSSREVLAAV